ncbi:FIP1[V]-like protein isoform X2 [Aristolochia californica]|uniref:FIP1[V]-like protein isoform X2 n=1 Tax=Aristolochia californica TaxID=171875 RepID=UPI0035DB4E7C
MEEIDDFGELYTDDAGIHVNAGISSLPRFHQLRLGEEEKSKSDVDGGFYPHSCNKDAIFSDDESLSSEHIGNSDGDADQDEKVVDSEPAVPVTEDENCAVENGSDSEDDLHIVLNEGDGALGRFSRCKSSGNRRGVDRGDDEEDDLVITSKDRKRLDPSQLTEANECSLGHSGERAGSVKGSYLPQYSQFKYVRLHASPFPSKTRSANGTGLNLTSSKCASTSSCDFGNSAVFQNGSEFSLPRNKTILDIGVETFEWKPWRRPGVDITDFFNFGLDEESWKAYCKCLENLRRQANMLSRIPVYESSRPNQVHEDETLHQLVSSKGKTSEVAHKDKFSSEKLERDGMHLEMPIGKAIQVEGGICERRPSMDVRCPRRRDSDVVIEIPVKDCTEDSTVSSQDEVDHSGDSSMRVSRNGSSDVDNDQNMKQLGNASEDSRKSRHPEQESTCLSKCVEVDGPLHQQGEGHTTGVTEKSKNVVHEARDEDILRSKSTAESPLQHQFEHSESPSYLESDQFYGSESDSGKTNTEGSSDYSSQDKINSQEEQNHSIGKKLHDLMEVKRIVHNDRGSSGEDKRSTCDGDHHPIVRHKNVPYNERQQVSIYDEKDLFDSRGRERMVSHSSRRLGQKQFSGFKHFSRRNRDDREYYLEQRSELRDDRLRQREGYFHERRHNNWETYKESIPSVSKDLYLYSEQERHMWHRRKSKYAQRERYGEAEEFIQEKYERHAAYCGREESVIEKYDRHVPRSHQETRDVDYRERYDRRPHLGSDKDWRHSNNYRSPSPRSYWEFKISHRRDWCEFIPSRDGGRDSWRSNERHLRDWRSPENTSLHSRRVGDEYWHAYHEGEHYRSSMHGKDLDSGIGDDDIDYLDRRRFGWESKPTNCVNDSSSFKRPDHDGSFYHETRPRLSCISDNRWSALDHQFENGRKSTIRAHTDSECFKHLATFRSRDSKYLNDWEGQHMSQRSSGPQDIRFHGYSKADLSVHENWGSVRHLDEVNNQKEYQLDLPKVESNRFCTISESRSWRSDNLEHSSVNSKKIQYDKHSIVQHKEVSDIGKGQPAQFAYGELAPTRKNRTIEKTIRSAVVVATQGGIMEDEKMQSEDGVDQSSNRGNGEFDDKRIRESLAKMERRRERFKEPIAMKKESDVCLKPLAVPVDEAGEIKQQRPVRKRRWVGH